MWEEGKEREREYQGDKRKEQCLLKLCLNKSPNFKNKKRIPKSSKVPSSAGYCQLFLNIHSKHLPFILSRYRDEKAKTTFPRPLCSQMWLRVHPGNVLMRYERQKWGRHPLPGTVVTAKRERLEAWVFVCWCLDMGWEAVVMSRSSLLTHGSQLSVSPWNHSLAVAPAFHSSSLSNTCQIPYIEFLPIGNT